MRKCIACGISSDYKEYIIREMMFGTRDEFIYLECKNCGCLQIKNIPRDLHKYYPQNYYSFKESKSKYIKDYFINLRNKYSSGRKNLVGKILANRFTAPSHINILKILNAQLNWKILDIGSGRGEKLLELKKIGFSNLLGIDPFIDSDINFNSGFQIKKASVLEIKGSFDLVLLRHSLEHMEDPEITLEAIKGITNEESLIIIWIPISGNFAWKKYREDWVQLDAPRHLFIPTEKSINLLVSRCGYKIFNKFYDSSCFQFWASEQYRNNIPLTDSHSYSVSPRKSIFSKSKMKNFVKEAKNLNVKEDGDQACFILQKANTN